MKYTFGSAPTADFDAHDLAVAVWDIAQEQPERVYERPEPDGLYEKVAVGPQCLYSYTSPDGTITRCIVGEALHRLGYPVDAELGGTVGGVIELLDHIGAHSESTATLFLQQTQNDQDCGAAWGEAVKAAAHATGWVRP